MLLRHTLSRSIVLAALLLGALTAFAQTQNAVVYGTVYDESNKPMPGVKVTLENPALAFSRTTTTGRDGTYDFVGMPPASGYRLTAAAEGKVLDVRDDITVTVGEEHIIFPALKARPNPMTLSEIEDALTGDVPNARIITLVTKLGVDFQLTDRLEARLRKLGADDKVIIAILRNKR